VDLIRARAGRAVLLLGLVVVLGAAAWTMMRRAPGGDDADPPGGRDSGNKLSRSLQRNLTVRGLVFGPYSRYAVRLYNCDDRCQLLIDGQPAVSVGFGEDSGLVDITEKVGYGEQNPVALRFENLNEKGAVAYGFEMWGDENTRLVHEECGQASKLGCSGGAHFREGIAVLLETRAYRPAPPAAGSGPARITASYAPDPVRVAAGGRVQVTFRFVEEGGSGATLTARSSYFTTLSGTRLSGVLGPYPNTITVPSGGAATWTDTLYAPPDIVRAAQEEGHSQMWLHFTFLGFDATGGRVSVPATLRLQIAAAPAAVR
jgi:hypothetical protein